MLLETGINFTREQKNIFEFIKSGEEHGIIDAVAGAGKTTTIMECSKYVMDKTDILFCAFNKSIQTEIVRKFSIQRLNQVTIFCLKRGIMRQKRP
jgi:superfamily II DNA or RNA helicase